MPTSRTAGDTFVSLGGDSLSYVAASVRLEQALGHLPPDWHVTPVRDLEPRPRTAPVRKLRRLFAPLETSIVLRAVAIVLIVSTHVGLFSWQGTAHVLMAVAGYNFARFQLSGERLPAAAPAAGQPGKNRRAEHGVHRGRLPDYRQLHTRQYPAAQRRSSGRRR